jgi:hypothetical protein
MRNVMTGSFTDAVNDIVNSAKSAVNRKLASRNVGSSTAAREGGIIPTGLPAIESSTDENESSSVASKQPTKFSVDTDIALDGKATTKYIFPKNTITDEVTFLKDVKQIIHGILKQTVILRSRWS